MLLYYLLSINLIKINIGWSESKELLILDEILCKIGVHNAI